MDYISRDELHKRLSERASRSSHSDFQPEPTWNEAVEIMDSIPAADVRPMVRGKWIAYQQERWIYAKCSECETVHDVKSNFCPNCGADMRDRPSVPFDEVWERLKNESAESREFFEAAERMAEEGQPTCDTCVHYPPSSCDGKPCTQCDTNSKWLNCYQKREEQT